MPCYLSVWLWLLGGLLITLKRYLIKHSANSNNVLIFDISNSNKLN